MSELLKSGQSIQLVLQDGGAAVGASSVVLRVAKDSFFISLPTLDGVRVPITTEYVGVQLPLADAIYNMRVRVEAIEGAGVRLVKPAPEEVRRIQRREFARSPVGAPCTVALEDAEGVRGKPTIARLLDLSGGGASTMQNYIIDIGQKLFLRFDIPGDGEVELRGTVVRHTPIDSLSGKRYSSGISFDPIDERTRSRIIRCVFSMQRELTRWGRQFR
jgi:c-di-GMP-binding flagellar brake protein YcgR